MVGGNIKRTLEGDIAINLILMVLVMYLIIILTVLILNIS
jgi:hypothetical protein